MFCGTLLYAIQLTYNFYGIFLIKFDIIILINFKIFDSEIDIYLINVIIILEGMSIKKIYFNS